MNEDRQPDCYRFGNEFKNATSSPDTKAETIQREDVYDYIHNGSSFIVTQSSGQPIYNNWSEVAGSSLMDAYNEAGLDYLTLRLRYRVVRVPIVACIVE